MAQVRDSRGRVGPAVDGKMEGKYEQSPDLCGFALPDAPFLSLTSMKAALFTAIVTAFVLDTMSDIDEDTATKLLRLLVEQSVTDAATRAPPLNPPSSTLMVSSLWFLSIMSSLAATTWAMLCLEWCAFLTDGVQAGDYGEMAEERQRKFEAVQRWRMHLVVAAIPFFLHFSLFLFLAGLWLRLRDVNKQLELIVGVPSLVIALSYVVVTFLPIFTDAPYSTAASELTKPVIRRTIEFGHSIHPPPVFSWIARFLPVGSLPYPPVPIGLLGARGLFSFLKRTHPTVRTYIAAMWKPVLPIIPRFGPRQNPFNELNRLKVGHLDRDEGIRQRALFWLLSMPLSNEVVKEILTELGKQQYNSRKPLDCATVRLLVLSLSSILEDNLVSPKEQPIFDYCTSTLAREMDRAFQDGEYDQRILFRNPTVFGKLSPHFPLTISLNGHSTTGQGKDYWPRAVTALWLCPSPETIRGVVNRLDLDIRSMEASLLQRIIRGLHAATLICFNPNRSTLELIPDFSTWNWDSSSPDQDLDNALSAYLRGLLAAFYNTLPRCGDPMTTTLLVIDCLRALNDQPKPVGDQPSPVEDQPKPDDDKLKPGNDESELGKDKHKPDTLRFHNALCFFVAVAQRSNRKAFEEEPTFARTLLESAETWREYSGEDVTKGAETLSTRLRAIAYGPRPLISRNNASLKRLGELYAGLPGTIKEDPRYWEGFLDAIAATLEAVLTVDGQITRFIWQRSPDYQAAQNILTDPLFTNDAFDFVILHPEYRLPYLYSLAIALSYTTGERDKELWKVADLLMTQDKRNSVPIGRALDTNILVMTVLGFAPHNQPEDAKKKWEASLLESLRNIFIDSTNWRARWKSIYLIADLMALLGRMNTQLEWEDILDQAGAVRTFLKNVDPGPVPFDWWRKRDGFEVRGLDETKINDLVSARCETDEGVYEWSGPKSIPYLSHYHSTESIPHAALWTMVQRWVQFPKGGRFSDQLFAGSSSMNPRRVPRIPRRTECQAPPVVRPSIPVGLVDPGLLNLSNRH